MTREEKYRKELTNELKQKIDGKMSYSHVLLTAKEVEIICEELDKEPKQGYWIKEKPPMVERYPFCSECGFVNPFENALHYCPNCGAKMESEDKYDK